jgi:hypothetical protein
LRGISVFVDPTLSALVSLLFLLCFLLGLLCAVCLSNGFYVVSVVCYINIAGRKSISSTKPFTRVTSTQVHHGNWFWSGNFRFRPSGRSWLSKPVANRWLGCSMSWIDDVNSSNLIKRMQHAVNKEDQPRIDTMVWRRHNFHGFSSCDI